VKNPELHAYQAPITRTSKVLLYVNTLKNTIAQLIYGFKKMDKKHQKSFNNADKMKTIVIKW